MELIFSRFANIGTSSSSKTGLLGGFVIGLSLGLVWTPCVGPILGSVISLSISGKVTIDSAVITLAYAVGTAIPMLIVISLGRGLFLRFPNLLKNTQRIQRGFGVLMILTSIAIATNFDRKFQTFVLDIFPQYGVGLTKFENISPIKDQLVQLSPFVKTFRESGRPMDEVFLPDLGEAPEIISGGDWFNTSPLTIKELKGKVILVDFWTYTCINCIRTIPYLKSWYQKYSDKGFIILGVHSPEFEFEKSSSNVKKAIDDYQISYPVVQDNAFATWHAYGNQYWPAKYLIDKKGRVRYFHFGEGEYDQTEANIQKLLNENTDQVVDMEISNPTYQVTTKTPELYLGINRLSYFSSTIDPLRDEKIVYKFDSEQKYNTFSLDGEAVFSAEYLKPSSGTRLRLKFESKEVYLVAKSQKPVRVKVYLDGVLNVSPGEDVIGGLWQLKEDRLYKLINLDTAGIHELILEFTDEGAQLFAFTFG